MPKEVSFSMNFQSNVKELIAGLEDVKRKSDDLKKTNSDARMMAGAQKSVLRTQAAAMQIPGVYGVAGANQYSVYKPTGAGAGSGGMMGALGMGAAAGAAAGGVMALTKVMSQMVKQSQIISKFLGTLSKLFGMLIDLVLLPFIPLLVMVILGLTNVILKATAAWNKLNPGTAEGATRAATSGSVNAIGQAVLGDTGFNIGRWIGENFTDPVIKAIIEWAAGIPAWWDENVTQPFNTGIKTIKDWWNGVPAWWKANIEDPFNSGLKTITDWANGAGIWWETNISKPFSDGLKGIGDWASGVSAWWNVNIATPFSTGLKTIGDWANGIPAWVETNISAPLYSAFKGFVNSIIGMINGLQGWLRTIPVVKNYIGADIPYLAEGGTIAQTGVAVVHKGETVVPAGQSGGGHTFNFPNYVGSKSDLMKVVSDAMRQQGARYNL